MITINSVCERIETFHRDKGDSENSGGFPAEKRRKREICFENSNKKSLRSLVNYPLDLDDGEL